MFYLFKYVIRRYRNYQLVSNAYLYIWIFRIDYFRTRRKDLPFFKFDHEIAL